MDPVADLLNQIRTAITAQRNEAVLLSSKIKIAIVQILKKEGYIEDYVIEGKRPKERLKVILGREKRIRELERVSKPGRRIYHGYRESRTAKRGLGVVILSTPAGVMTAKEARQKKLGGEVLCEVF